ncbi:MAG: diguanylate cyclase [Desulfamplus sp.]|nr:diguanylate cyclase [Desulfamplus sp.]
MANQEETNQEIKDQFPKSIENSGNILVVDDNPQNLRLLIAILSRHGYKVRPAPSGEIALKSAFSTLPELILLDIMMPEMDGYEVCQKLKDNELTKSIPVIFISAIDAIQDKVKAFEMGAVDYITKPFQAEEILARVNTHISLSRTQKMLEEEIKLRIVSEKALKTISLKYQNMAMQDYLTGVSNRRYFMKRAEEELSRAVRYNHPITFLMMDIDHFKNINDTYGHQAGDQILKNVATICMDAFRVNDLFGRIGGEEFAALLPETTFDDAKIVAERVRQNVEDFSLKTEGKQLACTISIGISSLTDKNYQTLDLLMKQADDALYLAKSSGRNCIR